MAESIAVKTRFTYNPRTLRYRDNRSGKFVKASTVKRATFAVVKASRAEMRRLSNEMIARRLDLGEWQERFAAEVKNLHTSLAMAGAGGMANMTPSDWGRVGQRLRFEYSRLAEFAVQLKNRQFTPGQVRARVDMYCNAGQISFEGSRRAGAETAGMTEERNLLGPNENHCHTDPKRPQREGCENLSLLGWVLLGTLPAVGSRVCISNCKCTLQFRRTKPRAQQ